MVRRSTVIAVVLALMAGPLVPGQGRAETAPQAVVTGTVNTEVARLSEIMKIGGVMDAMRAEGLDYAKTLEEQMFPGKGGVQWQTAVDLIYDPATMRKNFDAALSAELVAEQDAVARMAEFFGSDLGQRILTLELASRAALMDADTKEAAKVTVDDMTAAKDPRLQIYTKFEQTNDLIESNVAGGLNANLAFFHGMAEAGGFAKDMSEDEMLAEVWSQEADVRMQSGEWLYSYMVLAYQPLSDADMAAYQAFSETAEGKILNRATFVAFDKLFTAISHDLGRAAAQQMLAQDI